MNNNGTLGLEKEIDDEIHAWIKGALAIKIHAHDT